LGDAEWENFVLALLVLAASFTVAEALYQMIPVVFKRILKLHEPFHELLAIISLLVVSQGISVEKTKALLEEYSVFDASFIEYYGNIGTINEIMRRRRGPTGFYRTNAFELFYFSLRPITYFFGGIIAFYIVKADFISWIYGIGLSSVLVIYGFMPYIQSTIAHVVLLYTDRLRVGKIIEIPGHPDRVGCVLEMNVFSVKVGVLNKKIVERLWNTNRPNEQQATTKNLDNSHTSRSNILSQQSKTRKTVISEVIPELRNYNTNSPVIIPNVSSPIDPQGEFSVGPSAVTSGITGHNSGLQIYPFSPTIIHHGHNGFHPVDPTIDMTAMKGLSKDEKFELFQRIMDYGYIPNLNFLQLYYETRQE
jgi:hypothetical protein